MLVVMLSNSTTTTFVKYHYIEVFGSISLAKIIWHLKLYGHVFLLIKRSDNTYTICPRFTLSILESPRKRIMTYCLICSY